MSEDRKRKLEDDGGEAKKRKSRFSETPMGANGASMVAPSPFGNAGAMGTVASFAPSDKIRRAMEFQQATQLLIANVSSLLSTARKLVVGGDGCQLWCSFLIALCRLKEPQHLCQHRFC
jgi:hypothetical protein